jgi:pantoate--beta-alanine ligase
VTLRIATTIDAVRQAVQHARHTGQTIGLVPTMGALHAGHASLIRAARANADYIVVSIFVNPTQFGPNEDLARYPRPFEKDVALCAEENVQLVFAPEPAVIYPPGFRTFVEVTALEDVLCGASRPGHFRGVATVVLKLFNIVQPDVACFGQKDAQQARILRQMAADLDLPLRIVVGPIVREPDGLALSSRNQYLDPNQRQAATVLYQALQEVKQMVAHGERDAAKLVQHLRSRIESTPGARLAYAAIVDADNLQPLARLKGRVLVAIAVWLGSTRLIDNVELEVV